jgi:hypothetical protein
VSELPRRGLLEMLQQVPDPRGREGLRHPCSAMLAALICATLCGFRGLRPTVRWLKLHGVTMWHLLGFRRKPPVRQTYADILQEIDPEALERVLLEFVSQLACDPCELNDPPPRTQPANDSAARPETSPLSVEVWDGKTLRGTRNGERRAEQVLVRIQAVVGTILASVRIPAETNESRTALELVKGLVLQGKLIVGDAAYCQHETCQAIVDSGGNYLVTVKANQPQLLRDVAQAFVIPEGFSPLCS